MDYHAAMALCEKYIAEHSDKSITAQELADLTGYSLYHFCHVFRAYFDMSVGAYVRRAALHKAASDILCGKPIIEASLDACFDTSAGFSKAFKKQFGMSATKYLQYFIKRRSDNMEPKFVKKEAFSAIGYNIPPKDGENVDILESGAYWHGIDFKDYAKYHEDSSVNGEIGAWMHPDDVSGELRYFFGYVSTADEVPEGFVQMNVPAAEYAVFDVSPVPHDIHGGEKLALEIRKTWKYVFKEWLDASAYLFDESKLCFEFYHGEETKVYVPVKAK